MQDATLLETNLTVEGFGDMWQYGSDYNCVLPSIKMHKRNIDAKDREEVGHGWITHLCMAG